MEEAQFQSFVDSVLRENIFLTQQHAGLEQLTAAHLEVWRATVKRAFVLVGLTEPSVELTAFSPVKVRIGIQLNNWKAVRNLDW